MSDIVKTSGLEKVNQGNVYLERYKFILSQKDELNKRTFKLLTFFQSVTILLLTGAGAILWGWSEKGLSAGSAKICIVGILTMFSFLSFFTIASLIAGIMSWRDYRNEEFHFLRSLDIEAVEPSFAGVWRWQETYLGIAVTAVFLFVIIFVPITLMPMFSIQ